MKIINVDVDRVYERRLKASMPAS